MTSHQLPSTLLIFIGFIVPLQAQKYSVAPLSTPPDGAWCDVNSSGQVAGAAKLGNGFTVYAGNPYTLAAAPLPTGWTAAPVGTPVGINDQGQILGSAVAPGGVGQPFLYSNGVSVPVPLPAGWVWAAGVAVNDSGQVTGYGFNGSGAVAFIGTTSASSAIPLPPTATQSETFALNGSGVTTGAYYIPTPNSPYFTNANQAFTGTASGVTTLPLPSPNQSVAAGINDAGQVAGWLQQLPNFTPQAFFSSNGTVTSIPLPAGAVGIKDFGNLVSDACGATYSERSGHNLTNSGLVVGNASTLNGSDPGTVVNNEAWVWDAATGTRLLSGLLPSPWTATNAISVANSGVVLAFGTCSGAGCPGGNFSGYVLLFPQGSVCDLNGNPVGNSAEVRLLAAESLGMAPAVNDLNHDNAVNLLDVQLAVNGALGLTCSP